MTAEEKLDRKLFEMHMEIEAELFDFINHVPFESEFWKKKSWIEAKIKVLDKIRNKIYSKHGSQMLDRIVLERYIEKILNEILLESEQAELYEECKFLRDNFHDLKKQLL